MRLKVKIYNARAAHLGYDNVSAQAAWHGIDRGTMHAIKMGTNVPRLDTAARIARDLDMPIEDLFGVVAS